MTLRNARASLLQVIKAFVQVNILLAMVMYAVYLVAWVWLAAEMGLWELPLLKDTIIWFSLSGFPLLFKFDQAGKDERFFRQAALTAVGVSVFLEFFLNITNFSLPAELVMQPLLAVLTMASMVADTQQRYPSMKRFCEVLLVIIGLFLIAATAQSIYGQRDTLDMDQLWRSLALLVWLPLVALPFIYAMALFAGYELAYMRMTLANDRQPPRFKSRLALLLGLNGQVRDVHAFGGAWAIRVASAPTLRLALQRVQEFRNDRARQSAEEQERKARLIRYAGVGGADAAGKRLDQREFAETKAALRWLATCQMGWYRKRGGRYYPELLEIIRDFSWKGLPGEHGIVMEVRSDGQAWWAWRRTVTGWCFAMGAMGPPPDEWLYDGPEPPTGHPGQDAVWGKRWGLDAKNW
ncbi:MAG: hypothetical protein HYX89_04885 [Chloroflexi bacterium]|nr:hypothetical protein [Chloroflexota bacterium]